PIPSSDDPNGIVAAFWDDLDGSVSGDIYTQQIGSQFIIQWHNWGHYSQGTENMIFQVVLNQNSSSIYTVYEHVVDEGSSTFGIENMDGSAGLEIGYNQNYAHDQLLVKISRGVDWLTAAPQTGTIPPGGSMDVQVNVNSAGLALGDYQALLQVSSNDPLNNPGVMPVTMSVRQMGQFNMPILYGWNFLALPMEVPDTYYHAVFPNAMPNTLFGWNGSYVLSDSMEMGKGYWLRFESSENVPVDGNEMAGFSVDLISQWNIVGGPSCELPSNTITDPGGIIIPGTVYGFNGSYFPTDTLSQGHSYWIRTSAAGQIFLNCGSRENNRLARAVGSLPDLTQYPSIRVSDAAGAGQTLYFGVEMESSQQISFSLPPLPPANAFDARFEGDYRAVSGSDAVIELQASNYPVTIRFEELPAEPHYQWVLEELNELNESRTTHLVSDQDIQISNPQVKRLRLTRQQLLPKTFAVQQNYPNPFNPSTEIRYALPADEQVLIEIYNSLGQKVNTLVSARQKAGYYTVTWHGSNDSGQPVSSGVYFYRVAAGSQQVIKKMMLLK
ncbi:MAG: FlgD immunoglobulin-like domain containing protein, partial [Calditrichia bacterium]